MTDTIVLEEMIKYLRAHILGTEYIDSKEFALDMYLKINTHRSDAKRDSSLDVASPSVGGFELKQQQQQQQGA